MSSTFRRIGKTFQGAILKSGQLEGKILRFPKGLEKTISKRAKNIIKNLNEDLLNKAKKIRADILNKNERNVYGRYKNPDEKVSESWKKTTDYDNQEKKAAKTRKRLKATQNNYKEAYQEKLDELGGPNKLQRTIGKFNNNYLNSVEKNKKKLSRDYAREKLGFESRSNSEAGSGFQSNNSFADASKENQGGFFDKFTTNARKHQENRKNFYSKLSDEDLTKRGLDKNSVDEMFKNGPNTMDYLMGNNVPQHAMGAIAAFWLVNTLSGNKGKQTNAQLYGQDRNYMAY